MVPANVDVTLAGMLAVSWEFELEPPTTALPVPDPAVPRLVNVAVVAAPPVPRINTPLLFDASPRTNPPEGASVSPEATISAPLPTVVFPVYALPGARASVPTPTLLRPPEFELARAVPKAMLWELVSMAIAPPLLPMRPE